jgi:hypothetical protein
MSISIPTYESEFPVGYDPNVYLLRTDASSIFIDGWGRYYWQWLVTRPSVSLQDTNAASTSIWASQGAHYSYNAAAGGIYSYDTSLGSVETWVSTSGTIVYGEYVQYSCPLLGLNSITSYALKTGADSDANLLNANPHTWYLFVSSDGATWIQADYQFRQTLGYNTQTTIIPANTSPTNDMKYIRLVITEGTGNFGNSAARISLGYFRVDGIRNNDPYYIFPSTATNDYSKSESYGYNTISLAMNSSSMYSNSYPAYKAFNRILFTGDDGWVSNTYKFNSTTAQYRGKAESFVGPYYYILVNTNAPVTGGFKGEWLEFSVTTTNDYIVPRAFIIFAGSFGSLAAASVGVGRPTDFVFLASIDGVSWTNLYSGGMMIPEVQGVGCEVDAAGVGYKKFRVVFSAIGALTRTATAVGVSELIIVGTLQSALPQWSASTSYSTGTIITYNGLKYYLNTSSSSTGLTPVSPATVYNGWIPEYSSNTTYRYGALVYIASGSSVSIYAAVKSTTAVTPGTSSTTWTTAWSSGAYPAGSIVYHPATAECYYAATSTNATPAFTATFTSGWLPIWNPYATYRAGSYVFYLDNSTIYLSLASNTDAAPINQVNIQYWATAWAAQSFAASAIVFYNNISYIAYSATISTDVPSYNKSVLSKWIPFYQAGLTSNAGDYVYYDNSYFRAISAITNVTPALSGTPWARLHNSSSSYNTGDKVFTTAAGGIYYYANSFIPAGESIVIPNVTGKKWVPSYNPSSEYAAGTYIADVVNARVYIAMSAVSAYAAPVFPTTNTNSWVPLYTSGDAYTTGSFSMHQNIMYYAASNQSGIVPTYANTTGSGWVPLYNNNEAYPNGGFVFYATDQRIYVAPVTIMFDMQPSFPSISEFQWTPVYRSSDVYPKDSYVYYNGSRYQTTVSNVVGVTPTSGSASWTVIPWLVSVPATGIVSTKRFLAGLFGKGSTSGFRVTDFYRGGLYVPDIDANATVPISGFMKISNFRSARIPLPLAPVAPAGQTPYIEYMYTGNGSIARCKTGEPAGAGASVSYTPNTLASKVPSLGPQLVIGNYSLWLAPALSVGCQLQRRGPETTVIGQPSTLSALYLFDGRATGSTDYIFGLTDTGALEIYFYNYNAGKSKVVVWTTSAVGSTGKPSMRLYNDGRVTIVRGSTESIVSY